MNFDSIQKYIPSRVDALRDSLKLDTEAGKPRYYEIRLDDLSVVPRCNDFSKFESYKNDFFDEAKTLDIFIYSTHPDNFKGKKHRFILKEEVATPMKQELSGAEVHAQINAAITLERERFVAERTKEELEKTKAELKEAEEHIKKIEAENLVFKGKKMLWGNVNLAEALGLITESVLRRNTHVIAKLPGGKALAGVIEQDNKESGFQLKDVEDANVTFEKTNSDKQNLTEDQQKFLQIMAALEETFDDNELLLVMQILNRLLTKTTDLKTIAELLEIAIS